MSKNLVQKLPEELFMHRQDGNLDFCGVQSHYPLDGGSLKITSVNERSFTLEIGSRSQMKALKEVINFILAREPMTIEEFNKARPVGPKNVPEEPKEE
jgi:hypothetical protein